MMLTGCANTKLKLLQFVSNDIFKSSQRLEISIHYNIDQLPRVRTMILPHSDLTPTLIYVILLDAL